MSHGRLRASDEPATPEAIAAVYTQQIEKSRGRFLVLALQPDGGVAYHASPDTNRLFFTEKPGFIRRLVEEAFDLGQFPYEVIGGGASSSSLGGASSSSARLHVDPFGFVEALNVTEQQASKTVFTFLKDTLDPAIMQATPVPPPPRTQGNKQFDSPQLEVLHRLFDAPHTLRVPFCAVQGLDLPEPVCLPVVNQPFSGQRCWCVPVLPRVCESLSWVWECGLPAHGVCQFSTFAIAPWKYSAATSHSLVMARIWPKRRVLFQFMV